MKKFARKCSATSKGMNEGYCVRDGDLYFSEEQYLVKWLRDRNVDETSELSDEYILNEAYQLDEYYWTEWDAEHEDEWYDNDGNEFNNN